MSLSRAYQCPQRGIGTSQHSHWGSNWELKDEVKWWPQPTDEDIYGSRLKISRAARLGDVTGLWFVTEPFFWVLGMYIPDTANHLYIHIVEL